MKKMLALVLEVMMILAAIPAMADETVFKMGFDAEYPPYTYMGDDGEYTGFDIEMCQGVCDILGWKVDFVPVNWDTKLISLDAGEVDCIWSGLTIDVIDPEAYTLSMAYSNNSQMILTKKSNNINNLADLAGKIVGVQLGTSADILLQNDQAGSIDAIAIDVGVAAAKIAEYGDEYMMLDESIASEEYGICFRKADAEMCKQVEDAYMKLVEDGTYLSLAEKYGLDTNALCLLSK